MILNLVRLLVLALAAGATSTSLGAAPSLSDCPPTYEFVDTVDYLDPGAQSRIRGIERNHLNSDVESLTRGQSSGVGGDLRFILNTIPNHHRAMYAMMRLALRDKTDRPAETQPYTVLCWLQRATVYSPEDGQSYLVFGVYLARLGQKQAALEQMLQADKLIPGDANVAYNLGLIYVDLKDYENAREYAKRAYDGGFPLPGLRQKLVQAGQWRD